MAQRGDFESAEADAVLIGKLVKMSRPKPDSVCFTGRDTSYSQLWKISRYGIKKKPVSRGNNGFASLI
jgi:hypothetical protein